MKKTVQKILTCLLIAAIGVGCAGGDATPDSDASNTNAGSSGSAASESSANNNSAGSAITVVSREDGSGTRGAFVELFEIEQKNDAGEKVDHTTEEGITANSTSVMMTTVAGDPSAIGYISLGSLNDTVKAVDIDGTAATVENIKNGSYQVARPFNIATKEGVSEQAQDFIDYILSDEGQQVVEDNGYISNGGTGAYTASGQEGKIVVAGSSSVTPVMEKLKEAYVALNPNINIEIQQSDSSTGMTSTIEGICDIGMASRDIKESELEGGLVGTVIAIDGIAVIVHNDSAVSALSSQNVLDIFTGAVTDWSEIG